MDSSHSAETLIPETVNSPHRLQVSEVFGPTFQGEGSSIGKPCMFLRLAGCNFNCVWCDTPYTWDWKRFDPKVVSEKLTLPETMNRVFALDPFRTIRHLVITGGEPLLQANAVGRLMEHMSFLGYSFEIETNGTPNPFNLINDDLRWKSKIPIDVQFNISPKLQHSGVDLKLRQMFRAEKFLEFERRFNNVKLAFKFVVSRVSDFDEIDYLVKSQEIPEHLVYIMPEGITQESQSSNLQALAQATVARRYNLTTRLHILVWGNKRGV